MASQRLFPLVAFDLIPDATADRALTEWGHWLGGCNRPFGRQSYGLIVEGLGLVAVAVSASTVNPTCAGYQRHEVVELARLCAHPAQAWATRVTLRLWREVAPRLWAGRYWPVRACVSYANALRHRGDVYRFDGWIKAQDVPGGTAGGAWRRAKHFEPKTVWVWPLDELERAQVRARLASAPGQQAPASRGVSGDDPGPHRRADQEGVRER